MIIEKIRIKNFKSIYNTLELDFNDIRGFWRIGGSVGVGKTTVGEAIIFGLFGSVRGKNNGDLLSWGEKKCEVELWCVSNKRSIYIKRDINTFGVGGIYVEVDGEELVFTNKRDAQSILETDYYDTTRTIIELLCIISFNNFKSLITMNNQDSKKFLDRVLGFYILTEYSDICKGLRNENYNNIVDIENNINILNGQIKKIREISNNNLNDKDITEKQKELELLTNKLKALKDRYKHYINTINEELNNKKVELNTVTILGKNKAKEIEFINKGVCPTCGAPIDKSQLDIKVKEKEVLVERYKDINKDIKDIQEDIDRNKKVFEQDISKLQINIQDIQSVIIKLQEQIKYVESNEKEINNINIKIQSLDKDMVHFKSEESDWETLYDLLSVDIRSKILESFIPILNKNILKYTQQLQLPYVLQFDNSFKCHINIISHDKDINISCLSTGQLKTADMIVVLSVLSTIIGSSGVNILFLDELFTNLDSTLRNSMCSILKEIINPHQTVFIISHNDIDNRYFDGCIDMTLEYDDIYKKHSVVNIKKL